MSEKDIVIKFTEIQKKNLIVKHGISAEGIVVDPKSKLVKLVNPKEVAAFKFNKEQSKGLSDVIGKDVAGLIIDPQSFAVDIVKPKDITIAMWGEYASDY